MTDRFRVGSIRLAERKLAGGQRRRVFMYRFDFTTPVLDGRLGSPHALDLAFCFDNLDKTRLHGGRPEAPALAERVSEAWLAFARTGDPNHPGLPAWPAYDTDRRATMLFDVDCRVADDPDAEERLAWEGRLGGIVKTSAVGSRGRWHIVAAAEGARERPGAAGTGTSRRRLVSRRRCDGTKAT